MRKTLETFLQNADREQLSKLLEECGKKNDVLERINYFLKFVSRDQ